jgi:hypothetical protein
MPPPAHPVVSPPTRATQVSHLRPGFHHYALFAACALLVTLPLILHGPSCGHDFDFHLQSWFAAASAWHAHLLYPHWLPAANYGAGEPRFVFYPPLSWALGALLGTVLPWSWTPQAFTFLALFSCASAFYALARRWVPAPIAAGAACLYLANPYLLFVAYERTAYGELLAATAMPLVVLYTLNFRPPILRLALVVAALWLTNAPAAVMGCYLLLGCAAAMVVAARAVQPVVRACVALALGTGLASVYVLPAWYEQRWVEIARVTGPGMRIEDSYLFGHTGEPFHDQVLHTASWIAVLILAIGLLSVAISWLSSRKQSTPAAHPARLLHAVLAAALVAILLLLLPISEPVWQHAPQLHFLQFPWRWLLVASMLAVLAVASATHSLRLAQSRSRTVALIAATLLCLSTWGAGRYAQHSLAQVCDEEDNIRAQQTLVAPANPAAADEAPTGFEGTDEYTPTAADNGEIQQGLPAVRLLPAPGDDEGDDSSAPNPDWKPTAPIPGSIRITAWTPENKRFTLTAPTPRYAVLRLMDYPAWQVELNGQALTHRAHREDGLLTLPLPAGTTTVDVRYRSTPDVQAGRLLSLLSLGALALCAAWSKPRGV